MQTVSLKNGNLEATFFPAKGMNLISFKKGGLEIIDQSTRESFEQRFAGLGPLIGPHFYARNPKSLKPFGDKTLFPHIAHVKHSDPFSHGIGRYAPWNFQATTTSISGTLSGKDQWNGIPLSTLEGQNFTMQFQGELTSKGLEITLSVVSETASLVGIHYYYHLPQHKGVVTSGIQKHYYDPTTRRLIPSDWNVTGNQVLSFDLAQEADYAFHPFPNLRGGDILLDAIDYRLRTTYTTASQENAWQLYHPKDASFVCIEPCTAQDPRHANLTVSSIRILLEILD